MNSERPSEHADALDRLIDDVLGEMVREEPPLWLKARVAARLRHEEVGRAAERAAGGRLVPWWPRLASVGAVALAGLLLAIVIGQWWPSGIAPAPPAPAILAGRALPGEPIAPLPPGPRQAAVVETAGPPAERTTPAMRPGPRVVARSSAEARQMGLARTDAPDTGRRGVVLAPDAALSPDAAVSPLAAIEAEPIPIVPLAEPAPLTIPALEIVPLAVPEIHIDPIQIKPLDPGRPQTAGPEAGTR